MPKVTHVQAARKDYPEKGIKKGEEYYWWKFRFGNKHFSKTYPKPQQLTQSDFLIQIYDIQDNFKCFGTDSSVSDLESQLDDIKTSIEELRDECQDKLDSMPEQLQESSSSGQLLQERIDSLEQWINDLDGIDFNEVNEEQEESETDETYNERITDEKQKVIDDLPDCMG